MLINFFTFYSLTQKPTSGCEYGKTFEVKSREYGKIVRSLSKSKESIQITTPFQSTNKITKTLTCHFPKASTKENLISQSSTVRTNPYINTGPSHSYSSLQKTKGMLCISYHPQLHTHTPHRYNKHQEKKTLSLSLQLSLFLSLFLSFLTENHENGSTTTFTTTTTTTTTWLSFAECLAVRGRPGPTSHRVRPCQGVQHSGAHCLRSSLPWKPHPQVPPLCLRQLPPSLPR